MLLTGGIVQQIVDVGCCRRTATSTGTTSVVQAERLQAGIGCRRNDHSYGCVVRFTLFSAAAFAQQVSTDNWTYRDVTAVVLEGKVVNFVTRSFARRPVIPWFQQEVLLMMTAGARSSSGSTL